MPKIYRVGALRCEADESAGSWPFRSERPVVPASGLWFCSQAFLRGVRLSSGSFPYHSEGWLADFISLEVGCYTGTYELVL